MSGRNKKYMNKSISIGIFLPMEEIKDENLVNLNKIKDWLKEFNIRKIVLALPNISDGYRKKVKDVFDSINKINLIFEEGEERFLSKINEVIADLEEKDKSIEEIDEEQLVLAFGENSLDLIIKFGEKRIPLNFIWEKSYAEFFFINDLGNFNKKRFKDILEEFGERERRFGE